MKRYKLVEVKLVPLKRRIRYEIRSPLYCAQMKSCIRNRGTFAMTDSLWQWVFGSYRAAEAFVERGLTSTRRMRLSTLGYDACDYALEPSRSGRAA